MKLELNKNRNKRKKEKPKVMDIEFPFYYKTHGKDYLVFNEVYKSKFSHYVFVEVVVDGMEGNDWRMEFRSPSIEYACLSEENTKLFLEDVIGDIEYLEFSEHYTKYSNHKEFQEAFDVVNLQLGKPDVS